MYFLLKHELLVAALLGITLIVIPVITRAQEALTIAEEFEQSRAINEAKREATIGANVEFTVEERSKFWPLFWEYRSKVNKIDDAYIRVLQEYSDSYQSMSDSKAKKLTEAWLQIELDRYNLKKRYFDKFDTVLSAAKTLRIMQIENKLDVMADASVGKQVPLVVPGN